MSPIADSCVNEQFANGASDSRGDIGRWSVRICCLARHGAVSRHGACMAPATLRHACQRDRCLSRAWHSLATPPAQRGHSPAGKPSVAEASSGVALAWPWPALTAIRPARPHLANGGGRPPLYRITPEWAPPALLSIIAGRGRRAARQGQAGPRRVDLNQTGRLLDPVATTPPSSKPIPGSLRVQGR